MCARVRISTIEHALVPRCTIQFTEVDCSIRFCYAQPYKSKYSNYPTCISIANILLFCKNKNADGVRTMQKHTITARERMPESFLSAFNLSQSIAWELSVTFNCKLARQSSIAPQKNMNFRHFGFAG